MMRPAMFVFVGSESAGLDRENRTMNKEKQDVYTCITNKIIADLEHGVRTWMKP